MCFEASGSVLLRFALRSDRHVIIALDLDTPLLLDNSNRELLFVIFIYGIRLVAFFQWTVVAVST